MTVFNTNNTNYKNQYMFFGEKLNLSRFDVQKYPIFYKLTEQQLGFFWQPTEIDLSKDHKDFKLLSNSQKHIFTSNLLYQTTLDSIQSRSLVLGLIPHVSLPELESCVEIWSTFETLHSLAYAHIVRNIYANPTEEFDKVILNKDIVNRATKTIIYYDEFIEETKKYYSNNSSLYKLKEKLLLFLVSSYIMEGLNFFVSFACSFAFAELGLMIGNASELSLISRDEQVHLAIVQNILKKYKNNEDDPEMHEIYVKLIPQIEYMFYEALTVEKEWATYLFKDGSMMGLNSNILYSYAEYITNKRMKFFGIKNNFSNKNPLTWTDKYLKSSNNQVAPQEQEIISYVVGGIKNDILDSNFDEFKF